MIVKRLTIDELMEIVKRSRCCFGLMIHFIRERKAHNMIINYYCFQIRAATRLICDQCAVETDK